MHKLQSVVGERQRGLCDSTKSSVLSDKAAVKPEPPVDFWERLDALHASMNVGPSIEDAPGFTAMEYAEKYKLTGASARSHLCRLVGAKKLIAGWATRQVSNDT